MDDLRREICNTVVDDPARPPVIKKTPGVFHQTGGRSIPNRARIRLHSGKVVQRSSYRGRIGDGLNPGNRGIQEVVFRGVLGREWWGLWCPNFGVAGPDFFWKRFVKRFWKIILARENF